MKKTDNPLGSNRKLKNRMAKEPNAENVLPMRVKEETDKREKDAKNSETKQWLKKMNSIVSEARLVKSEQSEARFPKQSEARVRSKRAERDPIRNSSDNGQKNPR